MTWLLTQKPDDMLSHFETMHKCDNRLIRTAITYMIPCFATARHVQAVCNLKHCNTTCHINLCTYRYLLTLLTRFFHTLLDPASCLYHLIPNKRDNSQISKLRKPAVYEVPFARTNKFRNSFILYALN